MFLSFNRKKTYLQYWFFQCSGFGEEEDVVSKNEMIENDIMIKSNVDSVTHREELSILNMVGPQPTLLELRLFLTTNCSSRCIRGPSLSI